MLQRLLFASPGPFVPVLTSFHVAPQSLDRFNPSSFAAHTTAESKGSIAIDFVSFMVPVGEIFSQVPSAGRAEQGPATCAPPALAPSLVPASLMELPVAP